MHETSAHQTLNMHILCFNYQPFLLDLTHHQRDPTVPADAVQDRASGQGTGLSSTVVCDVSVRVNGACVFVFSDLSRVYSLIFGISECFPPR